MKNRMGRRFVTTGLSGVREGPPIRFNSIEFEGIRENAGLNCFYPHAPIVLSDRETGRDDDEYEMEPRVAGGQPGGVWGCGVWPGSAGAGSGMCDVGEGRTVSQISP
jgi:hypothetical protein